MSDVCGFTFCLAGLTVEIQELVTKTIRSPPINSGINMISVALLMYVIKISWAFHAIVQT